MPYSPIGTYACRAIQQDLIDYYGANTAEMKTMGSTSFIRWLLSPQNTRGFRQISDGIQSPIPGKKRAVAFLVDNPFCYDVCSIEGVTCETVRENFENPSQEVVFDLTGPAFRPCDSEGNPMVLYFAEADLYKYCTTSDTTYITRQIARFNKRFIEALDKRFLELMVTLVGQNAQNESITDIPFFVDTTVGIQTMNPEARWWLDQIYRDIGGDGQYGLVGGRVLNKLITYQKWAGLNDMGIDLTKIDDINPYAYYDRNADSIIGVNEFFQLSPGAVQLVSWNEHKGEKRRVVTDLYTHSTWIDPVTGLEVDFEWYFDYKCKRWTYEPYIYTELAVARPGGCGIPNANGTLRIRDCSGGANPPDCPPSES